MKKIILFAIVIIGCVASSFALSLNGFTISKNLATNSVVNISNLNINNTYKFGATEIISAVATGTRDFRNNTASTNTTTDLFRWSYQPDVELGDNNTTVDAYEISVNGEVVVSGTTADGFMDGVFPISLGDVVTVTLKYISGDNFNAMEILIRQPLTYDNAYLDTICDILHQDAKQSGYSISYTYTHRLNSAGLRSEDWVDILSYWY